MDAKELQARVKVRLQKSYANPTTVAQYMGGVSRILNRIPIELFGDEAVIRLYRQTLSEATKRVFATSWRKIFDELMGAGLPCVEPERLVTNIQRPFMLARAIEMLAGYSSYYAVSDLRWKDVRQEGESMALWNTVFDDKETRLLEQVLVYCWPDQSQLDTAAPIIPISPDHPTVPIPTDMVEDIIRDLGQGHTAYHAESRSAYTLYEAMCNAGMALVDIENRLDSLEVIAKMKRGPRERANATLYEAAKALRLENKREFDRLWGVAMAGEYDVMPVHLAPLVPRPPKKLVTVSPDGKWKKTINLAKDTKAG